VRLLVIVLAGYAVAASVGKLIPHIDWLVRTFGVSLGLAGLAISCVMFPGALAASALGMVVDRFGARRIAIAALLINAGASALLAVASAFSLILILRIFEGVGYALLVVAATVLTVRISTERNRGLALSVWSSFAPIGFALGQWGAAFASQDAPLFAVGMTHAAILLGGALLLALLIPQDAPRGVPTQKKPWRALRHAPAVRAGISFGFVAGGLLAPVALAPVVLAATAGLTVAETARLTALAALPGLIGRIAPGWLLDRGATPRSIFAIATMLGCITLAVSLLAPVPLWLAILCFALFQIFVGALPGLLSAMLPHVAPTGEELGTTTGMALQAANLGNLLGPPLALALYAVAGAGTAVLILIALLVVSFLLIAGLKIFGARVSA
jgi:MFS transporter, CP family, cyanate transporter